MRNKTNPPSTVIRDLHVEMKPVGSLKPYAHNARTHSKRQIRQIAESIKEFGFTNPVLIDDSDRIIAGHGRVAAAKLLGIETVPVIRLEDMTEMQIRAYVIADNKLAENAGWDRAHAILAENGRTRGNRTRARTPAPLKGLLRCTACGSSMTPSHTRRRGRLYRYYVCLKSMKNGAESCPVRSIAASEIEGVVLGQVRRLLQSPEVAARTVAACHEMSGSDGDASAREREVLDALGRLDEVWEELFPAEQTRILHLLVEGIDVAADGIDVRLRTGGIHSLVGELIADGDEKPATGTKVPVQEAPA